MIKSQTIFQRAELLLGEEAMSLISQKRVILFGVGGVGSWCAEGLVRSGLIHLTIVDCDRVAVSNINRQIMATTKTVGQVKVDAMKERLLAINPDAKIRAIQKVFTGDNAGDFELDSYDYVVDAIDSLKDKASLIILACQTKAKLFSSLGAALKMDPTKIKVSEFWKVQGDPLARALRNKFKSHKTFPKRKFQCVYSDELIKNKGVETKPEFETTLVNHNNNDSGDNANVHNDMTPFKAQVNGSMVHITAVFGFMLAGLVLQDIIKD